MTDCQTEFQKRKKELGEIFTRLCEQVSADLQRKHVMGKTVGVKIKFDNFKTVTRDQTLAFPVDQALDIRHVASQCLKRIDLGRRFRLLGVRVSSLEPKRPQEHAKSAPLPQPVQGSLLAGS